MISCDPYDKPVRHAPQFSFCRGTYIKKSSLMCQISSQCFLLLILWSFHWISLKLIFMTLSVAVLPLHTQKPTVPNCSYWAKDIRFYYPLENPVLSWRVWFSMLCRWHSHSLVISKLHTSCSSGIAAVVLESEVRETVDFGREFSGYMD